MEAGPMMEGASQHTGGRGAGSGENLLWSR